MAEITVHELKTWPGPFDATWRGQKLFDIRKDDRGYQVGDVLYLREWLPETQEYTGRSIRARVLWIVKGEWGLPADLAVMSICDIHRGEEAGVG